jgi:YVTN family beta-propeller protein
VIGSPITVGTGPDGVAITPDGTRAYVADEGASSVSVIDTSTNTVIGSPITVGSGPFGVALAIASCPQVRAMVSATGDRHSRVYRVT